MTSICNEHIIAAQHYHFILGLLDDSNGLGYINKAALRQKIETHLFKPETRIQFGADGWETAESAQRRALRRGGDRG